MRTAITYKEPDFSYIMIHPSNINFLRYRRYRITVEMIEEPLEVLIERLDDLLANSAGYENKRRVMDEKKKLLKSKSE